MPKLKIKPTSLGQKGIVAHLVILIILAAGLAGGLYLVSHPQIFKPKASNTGTRIEIVDAQGTPITSTTSQNVKVKLTYVVPTSNPTVTPTVTPTSWQKTQQVSKDSPPPKGFTEISVGANGPTARNPNNGQSVYWDGTQWRPINDFQVLDCTVPGSPVVRGRTAEEVYGPHPSDVEPSGYVWAISPNGWALAPTTPGPNQQPLKVVPFSRDPKAALPSVIGSCNSSVQGVSTTDTLPWSDTEIADWIKRNQAFINQPTPSGITRQYPGLLASLGTKAGIVAAFQIYVRDTGGNIPPSLDELGRVATAGYATSTGPGTLPTDTMPAAFPTHFRVANSQDELKSAREQVFDQNGKIIDWVLTPGPGEKAVFAQFKVNGVWEQTVSASIGLVFPESSTTSSSAKLFVKADRVEVGVDQTVKVNLYVLTSEAANLFNAKLNFPKDLLEVTGIEIPTTSEITNFVEKTYDNNAGIISIVAGVPNPGIKTTGDIGVLISTIIMKTKASGSAKITFDSSSQILKNSDNSNILSQRDGITISIDQNFFSRIISNIGSNTSQSGSAGSGQSSTLTGVAGSGDGNGDGKVDLTDLSILMSDFNKTSEIRVGVDMNKDNVINNFDSSLLKNKLIEKGIIKN